MGQSSAGLASTCAPQREALVLALVPFQRSKLVGDEAPRVDKFELQFQLEVRQYRYEGGAKASTEKIGSWYS